MLYRTFGPSVYLCGLVQMEWLAERGIASFRHMSILHVTKADLEWAQIVLFVRGDGLLDERMAEICHAAGKYIVYILDDDLLKVPESLPSWSYYRQKSVKHHLLRMNDLCDAFVSPSEKLLSLYGTGKRTFVVTEPSIYHLNQKNPNPGGVVRIGFAGSSDRGTDIDALLFGALKQLKAKYGSHISFEFFGVETKTAKELHCRTIPYTESYEDYQRKMAELNWDIGLAPMRDTHFHSCKHYNKLVEYCGFGIVGVYSKLLPYINGVEDGVTGLMAENTAEAWVEAVSKLIDDSALRERMAQSCLERAAGRFSVETAARELLENLKALPVPDVTRPVMASLAFAKCSGMASWYWEKYRKYGWKTPAVALRKARKLLKGINT